MAKIPLTKQQEKAVDITKNCCVTASAGTGKTFVLTRRYVNLLKAGIDLNEILCLTFTDKAAAEMREKIEREIRSAVREYEVAVEQGENPELTADECRKLRIALEEIHRCTISTFHGFCSSILKEYPLESGVPIGYSIMTGIDIQDLVKNTITETLEHPDEKIRPYVTTLYRFSSRPSDIARNIGELISKRKVCSDWFERLKKNPEGTGGEWNVSQTLLIDLFVPVFLNDYGIKMFFKFIAEKDVGEAYKEAYVRYCALQNAQTPEDRRKCAAVLFDAGFNGGNRGSEKPPTDLIKRYGDRKKEYKSLLEIAKNFNAMDDAHKQFMLKIMRAYIEVADNIAGKIEAKKNAGSYLNFDDLIVYTLALLEKPEFSAALADRYKHVLVDEVQDNDPALTKIVNKLTENLHEKKLFIVGDMKQSIYRFKGAEPETVKRDLFSRFKKDEEESELDKNFRTVESLIITVNSIFKNLYPEGNSDGIKYADVGADRENRAGTLTILTGQKDGNKNSAPDEAEMLASWIYSKIAEDSDFEVYDEAKNSATGENAGWRPLKYSDITILVRKKKDAEPVRKVFAKYGIRCHVYKGKNFYQGQEIYDFVSVINASLFHEDETSLYGALKTPYFGLTDAELTLAAHSTNPYGAGLWKRLKNFAEKETDENDASELTQSAKEKISRALNLLEEFNHLAKTIPLPQFLNEIVQQTGILTIYAAHPSGFDKIRDLEKFLSSAADSSASRAMSVYEFMRMTETCIEENIEDESGSTQGDETFEDCVQIMTYHVSKGLEYPVVVLFKTGEKQDDHIKGILTDETYGSGVADLKYPDEKESLFGFLKKLIELKVHPVNVAEEKRLLYVGMTRARDHLVLTCSTNKDGKVGADSYMEMYRYASQDVKPISLDAADLPMPAEVETALTAPDVWGIVQEKTGADAKNLPASGAEGEIKDKKPSQSALWAMARGTCIHAVFEGRNADEMCRKYGFEKEKENFIKAREEFYASELMRNAKKIMPELPMYNVNNADGAPKLKRADLLVQYEDGSLRLFDFKSGSLKSNEPYLNAYFEQLKNYSADLGIIFHVKIPAYLYFPEETEDKRIMEVKPDT
ncbi:MAG TPA: UvrD-helicase domain-containing protein [Methanocorpusculum sp.]|nr:UvrD-helicase domain-containing protein [Methanocorpusculum sp.]